MNVDFTKPLRYNNHGVLSPIYGIGPHPDGDYVVYFPQGRNYRRVNAKGILVDASHAVGFVENVPVTHKRWVLFYRGGLGDIHSTTYRNIPTERDLRLYQEVIAIKEVTAEEGEGVNA